MSTKTEVVVTVDGTESGRFVLEPGAYLIGRNPDCDIRVEAGLVSRNHARLIVEDDGWLVEDLGSANGTLLDGQPVTTESTRVRPAQTISIGSAKLHVRALPEMQPAPQGMTIRDLLPPEFLPGQRYEGEQVVARGGMGSVLSVSDLATKRPVAMKVMHDQSDRDDLLRFIEEAQVTAQLEHPNIVPVHELSIDAQDRLYYTMKLVRGITLRKVIELLAQGATGTIKKYPLAQLLTVFQKVCDAIAFAHARGVLHRDLKPENVMIGDFGEVLVMDWGLAKLLGSAERIGTAVKSIKTQDGGDTYSTLSGMIMGTPQYMAPEQAEGATDRIDARSDIYALGAILYQLLTLHVPINDQDVQKILARVIAGDIASPATCTAGKKRLPHLPGGRVPEALAAVAMKALARDRAQRYQSVADFQADIAAYQGGFATSAEHAGFGKQVLLLIRRHKLRAAAAALFLLLFTGFMVKVIAAERHGAALLARLKSTAPTLRAQAELEIENGNFAKALEQIEFAVELAPRDPAYLMVKGHILTDLLRFREAGDAYQAALRLNRNQTDAKRNLELAQSLVPDQAPGGDISVAARTLLVDALTKQGRLREAVILGRPLTKERSQLVDTWKAVVAKAGFPNVEVKLRPDGRLHISLNGKAVEDLSFLRGAPLGRLEIVNTRVADLTPLRESGLVELLADGTLISDLRPLAHLPLTTLIIRGCKVSDLSPLAGRPLKTLIINGNPVRDLSPLRGLPLVILNCDGLGDIDITPLAGLPLEEFVCNQTRFRDFEPLRGMKLRKLDVGNVRFGGLAPLAGMPLEDLSVGDLQMQPGLFDLTPLRGMPLNILDISGNGSITDLSPLADLPLTTLRARGVSATDLRPLEKMPLGELDLAGTKISDLRPLASLTSLRVLKLDGTPISDLSPLRSLPLAVIQLHACVKLRDVGMLAGMPQLKRLSLPAVAQNLGSLRALQNVNWIAFGAGPPETDTDGSRARQFWADYDAEEKARAAEPGGRLRPSRHPSIERRFPNSVQNDGHWYSFVYVDAMGISWNEARSYAEACGGHLVTITTAEEDEFVRRTFGPRMSSGKELLLGGQCDQPGGTWSWVNGEAWGYTRWGKFKSGAPGEPSAKNQADLRETVLTLRNDGGYTQSPAWNDAPEVSPHTHSFLIEWED